MKDKRITAKIFETFLVCLILGLIIAPLKNSISAAKSTSIITPTGFIYPTHLKPTENPPYDYKYAGVQAKKYYKYAGWLAKDGQYITGKYHIAQDIQGNNGDLIYAIADGEIVWVDTSSTWGVDKISGNPNSGIFVRHETTEGPFIALYGHVKATLKDLPMKGAPKNKVFVKAGQPLAELSPIWFQKTDETWYSSPTHLHFGICNSKDLPPTCINKEGCQNPLDYIGWGAIGLNHWDDDNGLPLLNGFVDPINWIQTKIPRTSTNDVDIALIIDCSGSMQDNDPTNLRKAGAKVFVQQARDTDQIAVVEFSDQANVLFPRAPRTYDPSPIISKIDQVSVLNSTNMRDGIQKAYEQLKSSTSGNRKAAVLLTDGAHNVGDYANAHLGFINEKWPIYTLGLYQPGSSERTQGEPLLKQIASDTGGQYTLLQDSKLLAQVYNQIARQVLGGTTQIDNTIHILPGLMNNLAVNIPTGQSQASIFTGVMGSTVDSTLVAPDSTVIGPDTTDPNIYHAKGLTYELYRITNPQAGNWTIRFVGTDMPAVGEDATVQVFTIPSPSDDTITPSKPTVSTTESDWPLIAGIAGGSIIVVSLIVIFIFRRRRV